MESDIAKQMQFIDSTMHFSEGLSAVRRKYSNMPLKLTVLQIFVPEHDFPIYSNTVHVHTMVFDGKHDSCCTKSHIYTAKN